MSVKTTVFFDYEKVEKFQENFGKFWKIFRKKIAGHNTPYFKIFRKFVNKNTIKRGR